MNAKPKFIIFIGKEEKGEFIHLPTMILDHLRPYYINEKDKGLYSQKFKKNNELLKNTLNEVESIEPGEYLDLNLKVRVYRRKE